MRTCCEGDGQIHYARDQSFCSSNLQGVSCRNLARQIVIDGPGQTRAHNSQSAPGHPQLWAVDPREHKATSGNCCHPQHEAAAEVFFKDGPCEGCGENPFQIQEKRGGRGRGTREANHEQHRASHSTSNDCPYEPGQVRVSHAGL